MVISRLPNTDYTHFLKEMTVLLQANLGSERNNTPHTLVKITELIRNYLDQGRYTCGVFLDLQKAFDTVDHPILLNKFTHYGIRGVANDLLKSYLNSRHHSVIIDGVESKNIKVKHGCTTRLNTWSNLIFNIHQRPTSSN